MELKMEVAIFGLRCHFFFFYQFCFQLQEPTGLVPGCHFTSTTEESLTEEESTQRRLLFWDYVAISLAGLMFSGTAANWLCLRTSLEPQRKVGIWRRSNLSYFEEIRLRFPVSLSVISSGLHTRVSEL